MYRAPPVPPRLPPRPPNRPDSSNEQPPQENQFFSGLEVQFVNAVDEDFMCPVCMLPLSSPIVTSCGHRFCKECIDKICDSKSSNTRDGLYAFVATLYSGYFNCPVCRVLLKRDKDVFPDKFTERKVLSLAIKCSNKGCTWTGELSGNGVHKESCPEQIVTCTLKNCTEKMARKNRDKHVTTTCQWRMLRCEHCGMQHQACKQSEHQRSCKKFPVNCLLGCGKLMLREEIKNHKASCPEEVVKCTIERCKETMARKKLQEHVTATCQWRMLDCKHCTNQHPACKQSDHLAECNRFPVKCANNCGKTIPRQEMLTHTGTDCPKAVVPCPFKEIDCQTKVCRSEIGSHIKAATSEHLDLARNKLITAKEEREKLKQQMQEKFDSTIKEHEELKETTRKLQEKFEDLMKENAQLKQTTRKLEEKLNYTVHLLSNDTKKGNPTLTNSMYK